MEQKKPKTNVRQKMQEMMESFSDAPRTFTDLHGLEWDMKITIGSFDEVKRKTGVDLFLLGESEEDGGSTLLDALYKDLVLLAKVFYHIVKAQHPEIDEFKFLCGQGDEVQFNVNRAFGAALRDFFLATRRPELAEMILMQGAMIEAGATLTLKEMQAIDVDTLMEEMVAEAMKSVNTSRPSLE